MSTPRSTLIGWFKRGLKPLETQFEAWMNSYWHKTDDSIPQSAIQNLTSDLSQFATTAQLQAVIDGLKWKASVRVATTGPITLSGLQTIDGIALTADDRVLVKNQASQSANGLYLAKAGAWVRTDDGNVSSELHSAIVPVGPEGTANRNTAWRQTTANPVVGTSNIVWEQFGTGVVLSNASESAAGIVEKATDSQASSGVEVGETGAFLFVTPKQLNDLISQHYINRV